MHLPSISIVTPSYNQGFFLERTIRSVLEQNYRNVEYIVVDGQSTDNSGEILDRYRNRIAITIIEKDGGQTEAINKGFKAAHGEIITWLNSDDLYLPGALKTVAEYFAGHPDVDLVYGDLQIINTAGDVLMTRRCVPYHYKTMLYTGCLIPQPASFFRRSVLGKIGYLDEKQYFFMDYDYYIRMGRQGCRFACIPKALAAFRLHQESKTISQYPRRMERQKILWTHREKPFTNPKLNSIYASLFNQYYRIRIYLSRIWLRGDWIPFRMSYSRKVVMHKTETTDENLSGR